jgi:hypothetical protein
MERFENYATRGNEKHLKKLHMGMLYVDSYGMKCLCCCFFPPEVSDRCADAESAIFPECIKAIYGILPAHPRDYYSVNRCLQGGWHQGRVIDYLNIVSNSLGKNQLEFFWINNIPLYLPRTILFYLTCLMKT